MAVNFGVAGRNHGAILVEAEGQGEGGREDDSSILDGRHFGNSTMEEESRKKEICMRDMC